MFAANTQGSDERNKTKLDTVKNSVTVKFNVKEFVFAIPQLFRKNKEMLRMIRNSAKYISYKLIVL